MKRNLAVIIFKQSITVTLYIVAGVLLIGSYMIPVYKYKWTQDPYLSKIVNSDAVLTVIVLSVLSSIIATIALIVKRKPKSIAFLIYLILVILNVYRLVTIFL